MIKRLHIYINLFFLFLTSVCQVSCISSKKASSEFEKNSVFGTIEPTREEYRFLFSQFIKNIEVKKGDFIADVGASWGYKDLGMSVITDSLYFYIQDINSKYVSDKELTKVASLYYPNFRTTPQTNVFHLVNGTERKTNLPDNTFDIIMLNNSLHEFTYVNEMIKDIATKLKPTGKVVVEEFFSDESKPNILRGCFVMAYTQDEIINLMGLYGLYITSKMIPENNKNNILVFEKNQERSTEYLKNKGRLDNYLIKVNFSDSTLLKMDSLELSAISDSIFLVQKDLIEIYPSIELWINDIGYVFYYKENYTAALSIFMMNVKLFPNSYNVYDSLGDAYLKNNQRELALSNFTKALELYPENVAEKMKLEKLKKELNK